MCVNGNPKLCPQKSLSIDTQTSDADEKVLEGKEGSGDSSEAYIVDSAESYIGEKGEFNKGQKFIQLGLKAQILC